MPLLKTCLIKFPSPRFNLGNEVEPRRENIPKHKSSAGFTLVEILIAVGLFAILASVSVIVGFDTIGRSSVQSERDLALMMLTGARARALANVDQKAQGVRITASDITLFEGTDFTSGTNKRTTPRNSGISVSPNPADIIFSQLSANVVAPTVITLTQGSKTAVIDVNAEGRIDW